MRLSALKLDSLAKCERWKAWVWCPVLKIPPWSQCILCESPIYRGLCG